MAKKFESTPIVPRSVGDLLPTPPNDQFILTHHPERWQLEKTDEGGYEILPILTKFLLRPGLNGVRARPSGGIDYSETRGIYQDRGWIFLPATVIDGGYLREYQATRGKVYADRWTTPRSLGGGSRVVWDIDAKGYNDFRRGLVESGTIAKPDPLIFDFLVAQYNRRIQYEQQKGHLPHVQKSIEANEEKKEALIEIKKTKKPTKKKTKKAPLDEKSLR